MERHFVLELAFGHVSARVVHVAAELRIADVLANWPLTIDDAAEQIGVNPVSLHRLLRALAELGVVEQLDTGRFALSKAGQSLRSDASDSVRDHILLHAAPEVWAGWGQLDVSLRTGQAPRDPGTGLSPAELVARNSALSATFRAAMADGTRGLAPAIIKAGEFSRFRTVVDLGGGDGTLLVELLLKFRELRGMLYELPGLVPEAEATLRSSGVADRCEVRSGDFFRSVPTGIDAYLLKNVLHELTDDLAITVLRNCRVAMKPDSRVLVVEGIVPSVIDTASGRHAAGDLNMLIWTGGRERTIDEFHQLINAAGLQLVLIAELVPGYHIIEAVPAIE